MEIQKREILVLPEDPNEFDFFWVMNFIRNEIDYIMKGGTYEADGFCRCTGGVDLVNLIRMGLEGELFHGSDKSNIDGLSSKIALLLKKHIIGAYMGAKGV